MPSHTTGEDPRGPDPCFDPPPAGPPFKIPAPSVLISLCRSNHLNYPDFDALETASVTSCSSAYSSRSESSILSPPCGSVTELSDGGSCDTFQEYDISGHRHRVRTLCSVNALIILLASKKQKFIIIIIVMNISYLISIFLHPTPPT